MKAKEKNINRLNKDFLAHKDLKEIVWTKEGEPKNIWFQQIFTNERGTISLVHLGFYDLYEPNPWEIYCKAGNLFEDVERFETLFEAIMRIKQLLKLKISDYKNERLEK